MTSNNSKNNKNDKKSSFFVFAQEAAAAASTSSTTSNAAATSLDDLREAVLQLTASDQRLVRYDAVPVTREKQEELCGTVIPFAASTLQKTHDLAALETLVLCITDHPGNRAAFAQLALHGRIVQYLETAIATNDSNLIAAIGHLIWIAVYGNAINHQQFAPAVPALAKVFAMMTTTTDTTGGALVPLLRPIAYMWAGAALQNLAASYCSNENDPDYPGCFWDYQDPIQDENVSINVEESGEMYIDATSVRQSMLDTPGLIDHLVHWACRGPFSGAESEANPSAALNAVVASAMTDPTLPPHEDHPNIVPWAAVGALKNLSLLPAAKVILMDYQPCFCRLSQSADWLEHTKASDLLGFLRPTFPCWFRWDPPDVEPKDVPLCVDHVFRDANGNTCYEYEYGQTSDDECATPDMKLGDALTARIACCGCNGGNNINMPPWVTTMDDLDENEPDEGDEGDEEDYNDEDKEEEEEDEL